MKVLIAVDATPHGGAAARAAAKRNWPSGTELRVITVIESPSVVYPLGSEFWSGETGQIFPVMKEMSAAIARDAADTLRANGRKVSHVLQLGAVADEIVGEAETWGADLIMLGSHGRRRRSRFLLGSVVQRVAAIAPCSVEIVREPTAKP